MSTPALEAHLRLPGLVGRYRIELRLNHNSTASLANLRIYDDKGCVGGTSGQMYNGYCATEILAQELMRCLDGATEEQLDDCLAEAGLDCRCDMEIED